jgi:hypothetical protein
VVDPSSPKLAEIDAALAEAKAANEKVAEEERKKGEAEQAIREMPAAPRLLSALA